MKLLLLLLILQIPSAGHQVNLSWQPETATSFYLFKSVNNVNWNRLAIVPGTTTSYNDTNVKAGVKYYYRMKAYCSTCKIHLSNNSNTVNIIVP